MADQWWANDKTVTPANELRPARSAVEFAPPQDPMSPAEAARLDLARASEARAERSETRAIIRDELQANKPTQEQGQSAFLVARIKGGVQDIQGILQKAPDAQQPGLVEGVRGGLSPEGLGGLVTRQLAEPERRAVADAQSDMLDAVLTLATGAAYTKEQLQGMSGSYFPQYGDTQEEIAIKNRRLLRAVEAAKLRAGPLADDLDEVAGMFRGKAEAGPDGRIVTAPGTTQGAVMGAVQGGQPILTDDDRKAGAAIQAAWDKSGNPEEVIAVAAQFGRTLRPEDIEFLRANVGKPVNIQANPTGTPTATQEAIGEIVATPVGESVAAAGLGAANAASFGLLDELAPVLGLDPQRVQMAKDYLRQKAPVSSLAGEIGGGLIPAAGAIGAAGKLLAGTKAAGAAPVIGEGAFGGALAAGEAPEGERAQAGLMGAAVGAGAGALGQRLFGGPRGGGPDGGAPPAAPMGGPSGGRVSAGAAALSDDVIRVNRAAELPVPVPLANFQKTRKFEDMQRARELAKNNEVGGPIRERMAQQQQAIAANFDAFIDETGAQVLGNLEEQGARITAGIRSMADKSKAKYRALYKRAQTAGETREPVSYQPVLDAIAAKLPTEQDEKVLRIAREAIERNDPNKTGELSIEAMEAVRKAVGSNMATDANQARLGGEVKGIIDSILDDAGGDVYRSARAAFRDHQATFKDVGIIAQLLGTKRNSTDRVVAAENVVARILAPGTEAAQLRKMRDLVTGEGGDPQAWAEVQGAVAEQIRRAAYPAGAIKDEAGQVAVSPAGLKRIIEKLDAGGKLNVIFDGSTAQGFRTLSDVAQDVFTAPPGSVNFSNTTSAWENALDRVLNTLVTGLPVSGGVMNNIVAPLRKRIKERPLQKEVQQLIGEPTQ